MDPMPKFQIPVLSRIFIAIGLTFVGAAALDSRRGPDLRPASEAPDRPVIYRQGTQRILQDAIQEDAEDLAVHRQLIYYQISDQLWAREHVGRDDIWMGKVEPNLPTVGWICGEYITAGGMSNPYFQHPYYYSFGTWTPETKPEESDLDPGPFRVLDIRTDEIQLDMKKEDFFALGLPYSPAHRLDMEKIRAHSPVIRIAPEGCIKRGIAGYLLISLGMIGIAVAFLFSKKRQ